ncbi:MAG: adenosylcobinamide-phosphate synthase CbiB [Pseudomonadota bacterium]
MLALALLLDAWLGEPDWLWRRLPHPVVVIGRAISWAEARLNRGKRRKLKGALLIWALCNLAIWGGIAVAALPFGGVIEVVIAAILLAQNSLVAHVRSVATGLGESLEKGREAVAMIVGRDVAELDESATARAAIESAAENFSDGVIAPAFWFALAGLPGILAYKVVNTADSMIGYRTERYEKFGWAAARLDDVLNWVPARLSGALIAAVGAKREAWRAMMRDAGLHRSPNAGWPEAAMAASLGVALSGPRIYGGALTDDPFVFSEGRRDLGPTDIERAIEILWRAWAVVLVAAILGALAAFL